MNVSFALTVLNFKWRSDVFRACASASVAAIFFSGTWSAQASDVLTFGIVPQQSATRLAQIWIPFLEELERQTGQKFKFATAKDIPTFEACLSQKAYDIAYMNPYHYTVVHETAGYKAFAHQADKKLKGILVTRADSGIDDLDDLQGQTLAFPSPAAFGASVIPRAELSARGVQFEPSYVKSHDSVYRAVALGLFPAGGGVTRTFNNLSDDLKGQLRVFYQTDGYTPHAFAAAPGTAAGVVAAVTEAMGQMNDLTILEPLGMSGFVAAHDSDWDDVRSLNLTAAQTEIVSTGEQVCHSD